MRILLVLTLSAVLGFGQGQIPEQGPPPKNLTQRSDGHFTANQDPANPENFEVHVVTTGETLSGIAASVLKDARLWPQLWEENDHIVNPHWIYPNDKILIRPVTKISEATPPAPAPEPAPAEAAPPPPPPPPPPPRTPVKLNVAPAPPEPTAAPPRAMLNVPPPKNYPEVKFVDLYCSGFIRTEAVPDELKVVARYNSDNALLAGEGDYIYIAKGLEDGVRNGTTYQIVRPTKQVSRPNRLGAEGNAGMHYLEVAHIRVVLTQDDYAMARVVRSCEPVEVGDFLVPYQQLQFPTLPARRPFSPLMTPTEEALGSIITTKNALLNASSGFGSSGGVPGIGQGSLRAIEKGIAGEGEVVYLDVGKEQGAKPGDTLVVFRQVDVESDAPASERQTIRRQKVAVGEVVILKVEERASTALVTYSVDGLVQGDDVVRR